MNIVETMLTRKMIEADPTLDTARADRKVLQVASQDFTNYLKCQWNLMGKEESNFELAERIEQYYMKELAEFESFVAVWVGMWLRKWKQRVKLFIGEQAQNQEQDRASKNAKAIADAEPLWRRLEGKREIIDIVVASLIKNAEICGTEMLAENLLKTELAKKADQDIDSIEQMLTVLNNALCRARELAQNSGPLIFVKVDKGYYGALTA